MDFTVADLNKAFEHVPATPVKCGACGSVQCPLGNCLFKPAPIVYISGTDPSITLKDIQRQFSMLFGMPVDRPRHLRA